MTDPLLRSQTGHAKPANRLGITDRQQTRQPNHHARHELSPFQLLTGNADLNTSLSCADAGLSGWLYRPPPPILAFAKAASTSKLFSAVWQSREEKAIFLARG